MAAKTTTIIKDFDAVAFMRRQRDKISKDIANMDFEEIKVYFGKRKKPKQVSPATTGHK